MSSEDSAPTDIMASGSSQVWFSTRTLPANVSPGKTHRLVVRVKKDNFAAGIWKPVKIAMIAE